MSVAKAIKAYINDTINNIKTLKLNMLRSFGKDRLSIVHDSGGRLDFENDGKVYYNGTEIGSGTGGVQNPMTADLETGGHKIKNTSGSVTIESSNGIIVFQKSN